MMQTGSVTTPFGRRPMTLALVRRQTTEIKTGKTAEKWKVLRDASAAMNLLGVQSNSLAVLDALLSFYPNNELRQEAQMIVFPSNTQLALRAHGMAGATLRRHLAVLVDAGLIVRRDSANGKRYARKDTTGAVESAFGFDLSPLLARSEELAMMAQQVMADRAVFRKVKEDFTICRRDVRKLISAALEEGAEGDWMKMEDVYVELVGRTPRTPSLNDIRNLLDEMQMLHEEIINQLEVQQISDLESTNAAQNEQHLQNSKSEFFNELEHSSGQEQRAKLNDTSHRKRERVKAFPLGMVLKACPSIADYGRGGAVESWRDLMTAAVVVRSMLGVSPSAYQDACDAMGPESAAITMSCILERANFINSAGGYLRDLTRRAERQEFSLGPMLVALLKANTRSGLKAG
jgi:replication initiation protein RepC